MSLFVSSSSPAATVTVCAVPQFEVVNVSDAGLGVSSVPAWPVIATVTVAVGSVASFTVYSASESSVTASVAAESTIPASSSSVVFTVRSALLPA